jgi:hypothetical protein
MMRSPRFLCSALTLVVATTACGSSSASAGSTCPLPTFGAGESYHPAIDAGSFTPNVDNPLFPLPVGTTLVYSGKKDGKNAIDVFAITAKTRNVDGVTTRVVEDRLILNGILEEKTAYLSRPLPPDQMTRWLEHYIPRQSSRPAADVDPQPVPISLVRTISA